MAFLKVIEASCSHRVSSSSSSKHGNKGSMELKRLECSIIMIPKERVEVMEKEVLNEA